MNSTQTTHSNGTRIVQASYRTGDMLEHHDSVVLGIVLGKEMWHRVTLSSSLNMSTTLSMLSSMQKLDLLCGDDFNTRKMFLNIKRNSGVNDRLLLGNDRYVFILIEKDGLE